VRGGQRPRVTRRPCSSRTAALQVVVGVGWEFVGCSVWLGRFLGTVCTVTLPPVEWQVRNEVSSPSHTYTCGELTAVDGKRRER